MAKNVYRAYKGPLPGEDTPVAPAKPAPVFVNAAGRRATIGLKFPMEYDGVVYSSVTIRRPTLNEVSAYEASVAAASESGGEEKADSIDCPYISVPSAVLNALDFIDGAAIKATMDSLFNLSPASPAPGTVKPGRQKKKGQASISKIGEQLPS
jgi:hypothetical protein